MIKKLRLQLRIRNINHSGSNIATVLPIDHNVPKHAKRDLLLLLNSIHLLILNKLRAATIINVT